MPRLLKFSLSIQILIGIAAGLLVGLFVGEPAGNLQVIGNIFVKLLQMTVLPYILFSLITAVGKLSITNAKTLSKIAGLLLLASWLVALGIVIAAPMAFPVWKSASFFSTAMLQDPAELDLLELYLPANPFHSLANNIIPAVVLFSIAIGAAIIGVEGKERLFAVLDVVTEALTRVTTFVARFTPIGIFAITASAAGTMSIDEFSRLQVYFVTYGLASLVMAFWIIPALLASLTPIPYRALFSVTGDALMTGFTTGNLLIILPLMTEGCKKILRQNGLGGADADGALDVLLPVTFNFPLVGKLLTLIFLPFAAWFVGTPLHAAQYPVFLASGLVSYFGSVNAAMPFLLDMLRIPADMFELFLVTSVVNERFATLLAALNMMVIGLLGACIMTGRLRIPRRRLISYCAVSLVFVVALVAGSRAIFTLTFTSRYDKDKIVSEMTILGSHVPSEVVVHAPRSWLPNLLLPRGIHGIQKRERLRVGYVPDNLPFAYENRHGDLVGLDIELAHRLAAEIEVGLAFVPLRADQIGSALESRMVDVAMAGIPLSVLGSTQLALTQPYLETTMALIVDDHARNDFSTMQALAEIESLRIAVIKDYFFRPRLERAFKNLDIGEVQSAREFFDHRSDDFDALLFSAEAGATWTLLYPDFSVVVPRPGTPVMPIAFAVQREDLELRLFIDRWIELAQGMGVIQRAYDHWFLGKDAVEEQPRWSIMRNVLGWTD